MAAKNNMDQDTYFLSSELIWEFIPFFNKNNRKMVKNC
jgi:hypothetical protein